MRILVVEDFAILRGAIAMGLQEAGYAVDEAAEGETALWHASNNPYDVIVLDLMLPKIDGLAVLKRLRTQGNRSHVLILTAKDTPEDRVTGLDSGADDYLIKPFAFAELLARVRALVRRGYDLKSTRIRVGDLTVETTTRSVERDGIAVELSAREYALLEYLMLNKGKIISRVDISERVWSLNFDTTTNVIDVYISYLRKKIDKNFSPKLLHTIVGMGYVLRES